MRETTVVALGGNALIRPGQLGTIREQAANLLEALAVVVDLARRGDRLAVTHGNGPQVGHILIRAESARDQAYDLPLDVCVAQSQGEMGYLIQGQLHDLLRQAGIDRPVTAVVTRTLVDVRDPLMRDPTKPVGPFYSAERATALMDRGWIMKEEAHRGYRRVVPSPRPIRILDAAVIGRLAEAGVVVIAAGGGGIPVREAESGTMVGVEAVVDKDLTTSLLASDLGALRILDLTAVDCVKLRFGSPEERDLRSLTVAEARGYLAEGHFAPGSMAPKIEGAIGFLERGGREVVVTTPPQAAEALRGRAGTLITP
jgi:carbamate kinase